MKTASFTASESSEEEVELEGKKLGEKECDEEFTYIFHELVSHEAENGLFENHNASAINRIISRSYTEPLIDNPYSPPEKKV